MSQYCENCADMREECNAERAADRERITRLEAWLVLNASHNRPCGTWGRTEDDCTCGLKELMHDALKPKAEPDSPDKE